MSKYKRVLQDMTDNQLACRRGHQWSLPQHIRLVTNTNGDIIECTEVVRCIRKDCTHRRETVLSVPSMEPAKKSGSRYFDVDESYHLSESVTASDIRREQFRRSLR